MSTSSGDEGLSSAPRLAVEPGSAAEAHGSTPRAASISKAPVFIVGCPRSGTTLLYHMLLSAGGFAVYRAESNVFNLLAPRFGDLGVRKNRQKLMDVWLRSYMFSVSGLNSGEIEAKVLDECRSSGDFFRIIMEEMARQQNVDRWADCTPEHVLFTEAIQEAFPGASVVHIIRDGRDVALSLAKLGWIQPIVPHRNGKLIAPALYWEWIVRTGRAKGRKIAPYYTEVRYENLIREPRGTLAELGRFIGHDLDYDRIKRVAIGSVSEPNTSFRDELLGESFNPLRRWERLLQSDGLAALERFVGDCLSELGYALTTAQGTRAGDGLDLKLMRSAYLRLFDLKFWVKTHTPLSRVWIREEDRLPSS